MQSHFHDVAKYETISPKESINNSNHNNNDSDSVSVSISDKNKLNTYFKRRPPSLRVVFRRVLYKIKIQMLKL